MSLNSNLGLLFFFFLLLLWQWKSPQRKTLPDLARTKTIFLFLLLNISSGVLFKKIFHLENYSLWNLSLHPFLAFLLLDYSTFIWHYLNHKLPWLWRFHQVHHTDRRLDTLSALRFHLGEYILSFFFRGCWTVALNLPLRVIVFYELTLTLCNLFHHSNIYLGVKRDTLLSKFIVTPLYHLRHHSFILSQTDSNFSSIFSFWDKLHRTYSEIDLNITIGIPELELKEKWSELFLLPFKKIKPWPKKYL